MSATSRSIRLGVATGVIALALAALPVAFDDDAFASKAALADAGGNGKGKGKPDNPGEQGQGQQAKASHGKGHMSKDDPMHPSNLGRLNGFLNASPQALLNTSPNSAIGILSKTYADALAGYLATDETTTTTTVTEDDLAAILAKAANKPLTGEQIIAINEKLMSVDPELAEAAETTTENPDGTTTTENELTDPELAEDLAERANEIQATETSQGLGSGDDDADDSDDVGDDIADAAEAVGDAAEDTADAVGDFFNETF